MRFNYHTKNSKFHHFPIYKLSQVEHFLEVPWLLETQISFNKMYVLTFRLALSLAALRASLEEHFTLLGASVSVHKNLPSAPRNCYLHLIGLAVPTSMVHLLSLLLFWWYCSVSRVVIIAQYFSCAWSPVFHVLTHSREVQTSLPNPYLISGFVLFTSNCNWSYNRFTWMKP